LAPHAPLAAARIPLVGTVTAPWHPGFDPAEAIWKDAEGREFAPYARNRPFIGETVGQVQQRAWRASDRRLLDAEGAPCGPGTTGPMEYGPTFATRLVLLGKESRRLGIGRGLLFSPETAQYGGDDPWPDVVRAANRLVKDTAKRWKMEE